MSWIHKLPAQRRTLYGGLVIGTVLTLLMLLVVQELGAFVSAERAAYDWQFQHRGARVAPTDVVVVGMDADSLKSLDNFDFPPKRVRFAEAVTFLHSAGARVIGVDFSFSGPSRYGGADDTALARALRSAGVAVIGRDSATPDPASPPVAPLPVLAQAAIYGLSAVTADTDGSVRSYQLRAGPAGHQQPSFALALAAQIERKPAAQIARGLDNRMLINYPGGQDPGNPSVQAWRTTQFLAVALGEDDPSIYRHQIVLIVPDAVEFGDVVGTPYGEMYPGFIQASALETILRRDPIVPAGNTVDALVLLLLGLLTTLIASRFGIIQSVIAALILLVGLPFVTLYAFSNANYWLHLVTPEATVVAVFAAIMGFRFATEERQKRRAHRIFGQYVKPEVVELLVNASDQETALMGGRRPVSVLFVDIRGFTAMSEHMEPENVVKALDIYLEELTQSVDRFDGTVSKYVGDCVAALWNAPRWQADHPLLAVQCGLDMIARMDTINQQLGAQSLPQVRYGIGVNTGDAIVGSMGSSLRKQYDIIGDSVIVGDRLCGAAAGGEVIIGELTWQLLGDRLEVEEIEPMTLNYRTEPMRTFKVLRVLDVAEPRLRASTPVSSG